MVGKLIKKLLSSKLRKIFSSEFEKGLILKAKKISFINSKKKIIKNLSEIEFKVFSQWGEDGIIDWILSKNKKIPKIFLEIGTEDYSEANTRFLLQDKNWKGYLIEGNKLFSDKIKKRNIYWKYDLSVFNYFVNSSNINKYLKKIGIPNRIGLLSLDVDSIDYWIIKELKNINPAIIICEFNPIFGTKERVSVPDKKRFIRNDEHYSNLYYGASIRAYQQLLKKKNYIFLGTNSAGNNAFFINKNFSKNIVNAISDKKIFISKFRESRNKLNKLTYLSKKDSLKLIKNKFVFDFKSKKIKKIAEINI